MAGKTYNSTIKFTGQFDTSQITKGLQDIKKQVSSANIGDELKEQFEDAFKKLEVNIPALEKLTSKEDFNLKDIQALQKLLKEVTKDWENLNKVTNQIDLSKTFSAKDLEKINNLDKQIKQTQDNIQKARKELVDTFSNETKISISNKNVTDALTELFTVKPNEIDNKFQEIQQQFSEGVQQTQIELENKLKGANIQKTSSQILDYFFGKDSGVEFAAKVGPVKDQLNLIIKAYREAQEKGDIAGVAEQVNKLNEVLTNTANFKFPEGYKLFGLPTEEDLDTLNQIGGMLQKVRELAEGKEVFFTEEEARLAEQMAEKLKVETEAAKNAKDANEQVHNSTKKVGEGFQNTGDKVEDLVDRFNKIKTQTEALNATFGGLAHRIENSISALAVFNKSTQIIRNAIKSVEDLDAAFTQIAIVSEQSSESAWKMFDSFNKLAKQYSITTKDLTEGAKLFYQQGLNAADTMKMVEASTVSAALGEVTMTEAANTLTAAIQGYNESAAVAMDYTDKIAMVGAVSAADFNELSAAMEKTASSAYTAGIDFDHLLGYLGKMIEVTREAPANLGTAMKTIIARFEDMKKDPLAILEDGVTANKVEAALATIGIALRDTAGEFRPLQDVFDELGMKWQSLTRNQQAYIATVAAGSRQQSRFLAMMNNYDRTLDLISESMNSAGAAAKQYETYQDSIAAAQARLTASWENFYSKIVDNGAIKFAINGLSSLVDALSKVPPIITAISISLGALKIQNLIKNITNSNTILGNFISNFRLLAQGAKENELSFNELVKLSPKISDVFKSIKNGTENSNIGFSSATKIIGAFIKANIEVIAIMAAVAGTIYIINKAINANKEAYEKSIEAIKKYNDEAEEISDRVSSGEALMESYDELSSKISLTEEEQNKLNDTIDRIKDIYPDAIEYVDQYGNKQLANAEAIKDNIELEKQLAKERQRSALQEKENLLNNTSPNEWKPQDFTNIGYSNTLIDSYFSNKQTIQKLKGLQGQLDNRFWEIYNSIGNAIDTSTGLNETARHNAILELNSWIDKFGITIDKLGEKASKAEIFDFKQKLREEIEKLQNSLPEQIEDLNQLQNDIVDSLHRKNILDISFLDVEYDKTSKKVSSAQKVIAAQIESMFEKMDINIWNEFLNTNNIDIKHPEQLTEKIQEILNEVTEDNAIELQQLFKDLNSGEITAARFYEDFEKIAFESGSESAKNFIEAFGKQLDRQLEKEKDKYREFLNSLGLTQEEIEKALIGYELGTGNRRQTDIQNYYMESNGPMQNKINKYLSISDKTLDEMTKKIQEAVENGDILALQNLPNIMIEQFEDFDEDAGMILLNGKIKEAIDQLVTLSHEEANKIIDDLFAEKDYSKIKASEAYQYKEVFSDEGEFYSSLNYKEGSLQFTESAQLKLATAERKKDIELLENEILKEQVMVDILEKQKEDTGDTNEELENQIKELKDLIKYYEKLLDKANNLPVLLQDSMDITEDLVTAAKQYNTTLDNINHNKSNDARTLKTSAEIGEEYEKIVKITKTLDEQMKSIGHVSQETMTSMLEMGGGFADFFTIKDDQTIIYGLEKVKGDYQSASEAIINIAKKRREAELELQRQQIDDEIVLVQAKIDGYNKIADALEEYAEFQRNTDENTTQEQKNEAKTRVETQINAAEKSIENAENTWQSQVEAAKMAYDQMSELDVTFWAHLGDKEIKKYVNDIYGSFKEIKAPEHGVIDLSSLIEKGDPQELEDAAGKYRNAAKGLQSYIDSLQKAKDNLKAIDPTIYDDMEEKLKNTGQTGKDAFDKIAKAIEDADKALQDLDNLLIEIKRDLKDITVDYNPFTDLFEAWEAEWDYYYNIKNLINQLETQANYIDKVISSDYSSAQDKLRAYDAKVGNITSKLAANDAYILSLRAGIAQQAKEFEKEFNEYYNVDNRMGGWQIFQRDTTLNQWEETINDVKKVSYELSKLINQQENELNLMEATQEALEQQRSAYESMLSTVDSLVDSLEDNEDITVDLTGLKGMKVKLEAAIDDGSIEEVKQQIRDLNDYIQELNWQLDLNDNVVEKGLEDAYDDMQDSMSHIQDLIDTLNDKLAEQQELVQELSEVYNYYVDTAIDMQQELYNAIVKQYQDEINQKKQQYDYLKQLDKDYLQSVKDNINKERQAREDANKEKSYQQSLQRAQLLQQDTSGAYRKELANLNKEIESQRQDLYDDLVDKQVNALEKEIEKRHELYDMEVNALQERLDYMQENAILLWEMVNDIVAEGADSMMATLENTTNYINQNELTRERQRRQWELNTQATYKGVIEGEIESLNQRIAKGKEYIDSLTEIKDAIDLNTQTYIMSKDILEDEAGKMQIVMDSYMQVWTTLTSDLTGYHENWKTTVNALISAMEKDIQALSELGDEGGSIYVLKDKLLGIADEMYDAFLEERRAMHDSLNREVNAIEAEITGIVKNVGDTIQRTADSIQINPNKDNGSSGGGSVQPTSGTQPTNGGVQPPSGGGEPEKETRYKATITEFNSYKDYVNERNGRLISTYQGYYTPEDARAAAAEALQRLKKNKNTSGKYYIVSQGIPYAFLHGGFANFTGPAWLDGTKSEPEAVLNAKQTRLFTNMVSSLERAAANNSNINSTLGSSYNIGDINTNINVDRLDNETDIDKVAKQVENRIMKSIHNRVVLSVV